MPDTVEVVNPDLSRVDFNALFAGLNIDVDDIEPALTALGATSTATLALLTLLNAKLVTGTDIGDVTINNAAAGSAVNIQDGGNTITVDGTVTPAAQPGVDIGDVTVNNAVGDGVYVRPGTSAEFAVSAASGKIVSGAIADLPVKGQAAMAASVPVTVASDQSPVAARGTAFRSASNTLTRPGDTTQYTAGDVVVGLLTFASVGRANGAGAYILNPRLISSVAPATTGSFKLWLFSAAPTVAAEHAAFAPTDAQMTGTCLNIIYFDRADKTGLNTLYTQGNFVPIYLKCAAGDTSVYGVLTDANGYAPGNSETFDCILSGVQD